MNSSPVRWLILAAGIVMTIYAWQTRQPHTTSDFTIFYISAQRPAGEMYVRPAGPPRGNMNPPHFQLLLEPLAALPLPRAAAIWRGLNVAALCACLWWLARHSNEKWGVADFGAVLAWAPMQSMISLNQLAWIAWPLLLAAWWCWRRDRWIGGAVAFGVALSFKSFLGVFLIWLVLRGQWRAAMVACASAAIALAAGVSAYGIGVFRAWVAAVGSVEWSFAAMNASLRGVVSRVFTDDGAMFAPVAVMPWLVTPLFLAAAAAVLIATFAATRDRSVDESWPALMASALLASPLGWIYYIWWMLPGTTPARLLVRSPLLWVPMWYVSFGQPSGWATLTIGSVYTWGLLLAWRSVVPIGRNRIGGIGPEAAREVVQRDPYAPAVR